MLGSSLRTVLTRRPGRGLPAPPAARCRRPGERPSVRFQLEEAIDWDLCSADPWLVLHKIDAPTKMRYVGARVANCSSSSMNAGGAHSGNTADAWLLPGSIEPYVSADNRAYWAQQREAALKQQQQLSGVASEQLEQQQLAGGGGPPPPVPGAAAAAGSSAGSRDRIAAEIEFPGKQGKIRI